MILQKSSCGGGWVDDDGPVEMMMVTMRTFERESQCSNYCFVHSIFERRLHYKLIGCPSWLPVNVEEFGMGEEKCFFC
jgi:hypothetical protein